MTDLETRLRAASAVVDWPDSDLAGPVAAAIERSHRQRPAVPRWAFATATVLVLLLAAMLTPGGRQAVANVLDLIGIRVTWGASIEVPESTELDLGNPVSLDGAADLVEYELLLPEDPPDSIYHTDGSVHMVWLTETGDVERIYSHLPGSEEFEKVLRPETGVSFVRFRGVEGIWIDGAPHLLQVFTPDGELKDVRTRMAANVLAWDEGGVTYRVETTGSLEAVLEFVEALGK